MGGESVDWARRYEADDTPWDIGGPHPELSIRLQDGRLAPSADAARALVVGAGLGHDALAFARRGWEVTAIDAVADLEARVGPLLEREGGRYLIGDALTYEDDAPFDLVWDHTFFCAIDPSSRRAWGERAGDLLAPGGSFASLVFPVGKPEEEGGPPHGMTADDVREALGSLFRVAEHTSVDRPVPRRTWREEWLQLTKTSLSVS